MKVLAHDAKTHFLKLRVESGSDLWRVSRLVIRGDVAGAFTHRRDPEAPIDTPGAQRERRPVFLSIRVEQQDFHEFTGHLRLTGPIVEGPFDIGKHHTLDLEEGAILSLTKEEITSSDWALIDEGKRSREDPTLVIACLDWGEGAIVRLRGRSLEVVQELSRRGTGKMFSPGKGRREKDDQDYLAGVEETLRTEAAHAKAVVLAGPGFCKEELYRRLTERGKDIHPVLASASEAGLPGIHELLRSGKAETALQGQVLAEEASEVERLVRALSSQGMGAVGPREVRRAVDAGAVETLLVADTQLREPSTAALIDGARGGGARVVIVRHEGEPGHRLSGLGGLGAILRYRLPSA